MKAIPSNFIKIFSQSMHGKDKNTQDNLWKQINNPIIENIADTSEKLVTFLYRMQENELDDNTSIYLLSGITGYSFNDKSQFTVIPGTDIAFLSLEFPSK